MTLYLWDQSHYDGVITRAILTRARAEGVFGITHKIGEGIGGDDPQDATALAAGRDVGMEALGGYHVVRSGPVAPQVDALLGLANRDEPWWSTFPGWFWQADLERWSYDNVPASTGVAFAKLLRERTQRQVFLYASHGQYADQLAAWDGPLWNADYASRPAGTAAAMYPGDTWQPQHQGWVGGWAPYSGQSPTILQYTSSAVIAGLTTCDANAYRGTRDQLLALIRPGGGTGTVPSGGTDDMELGQEWDGSYLIKRMESICRMEPTYTVTLPDKSTRSEPNKLVQAVVGLTAAVTAIASKVDIDPAELRAIQDAATTGAAAAFTAGVPVLVDALFAKLPPDTLTRDQLTAIVSAGVHNAFSGGLAPDATP